MRRVLLITGASSGVGLSLAKHLSNRYEVVAVARREERMQEELGKLRVTLRQTDLSDPVQVSSLVDWLNSEYGIFPMSSITLE